MIPIPKFRFFGSLQNSRNSYDSEQPLVEVWAHVSRFGTHQYLHKNFLPDNKKINWDDYLNYVKLRVQQSVEFKDSSLNSSLLTSPLTLYYSFLNLTRAFLAFGPEIMPKASHGLIFEVGEDLLSSRAVLKRGTFGDYLDSQKIKWNQGDSINLADVLGYIIEIRHEYAVSNPQNINTVRVFIDAINGGQLSFRFDGYRGNFEQEWKTAFPTLADYCDFQGPDVLVHKNIDIGKNIEDVKRFVRDNFAPFLTLIDHATWFITPQTLQLSNLPRASYYYLAMFILGSAVRYQPELILAINSGDSEVGWLLRRFIFYATRHFPQLKLMELYKSEIYF